jgi:uncharacterized protein YjbI with pentapeptide repeats
MANEEQLALLRSDVQKWNAWRRDNPEEKIDLYKADLSEAVLRGADFSGANLRKANLREADLCKADLSGADLIGAYLREANLSPAWLNEANLRAANLSQANLSGADLSGAYLAGASLLEANLSGATLSGCNIYGISAWNVKLERAQQSNLVITRHDEPAVTVDSLEVAQFVYLLLNNENVRHVIDTITSKVVLILGRFTDKRKAVLDALKDELRKRDFSPIVFDFEKPASKNITGTVSTLAHMARFVVADITDAKVIPDELRKIVPNLPSLPVQPIILKGQHIYASFGDIREFPWVLPLVPYSDTKDLLENVKEKVIVPALEQADEIVDKRKAIERELASLK